MRPIATWKCWILMTLVCLPSAVDGTELVPIWTEIRPPAPTGRHSGAQIYDPVRDRMLMFGGRDKGRSSNELWELPSSGTSAWRRIEPAGQLPSPRYLHAAAYDPVADRMIVFGGISEEGVSNELWALQLDAAAQWTRIDPGGNDPGPRHGHSLSFDPATQSLVVFGGLDLSGARRNDLWRFSLVDQIWTKLDPGASGVPVHGHAGIWDTATGRFLVVGGIQDGVTSGAARARRVNDHSSWSIQAVSGTLPALHEAAWTYQGAERRLLRFGGEGPKPGQQDSTTWMMHVPVNMGDPIVAQELVVDTLVVDSIVIAPTIPRPRVGATLIDDRVLRRQVLYGGQVGASLTGEVWAFWLDPQPRWRQVAAHGINPLARRGHTTTYDPVAGRMIMFGGQGRPAQTWSFTLADSFQGVWSQLSLVNPPARYGHSATYDPIAHRIIVFGGYESGAVVSTMWQLELNGTPRWSVITVPGAPPPPRAYHTAAYDSAGNQLLIQGGVDPTGTGIADMWTLKLDGASSWQRLWPPVLPESRTQHAATLDPLRNRLLVHGGLASAALSDLWQFTLDGSENWTRLQSSTVPAARYGHSWVGDPAGDRMMMFGGHGAGPTQHFSDLWQFSAGNGTWFPYGLSPLPAPRASTLAAYDSQRRRLVCFGGTDGDIMSDTWQLSLNGWPAWTKLHEPLAWPGPFARMSFVDDPTNDVAFLLTGFNSTPTWAFSQSDPGNWRPFGVLNGIVFNGQWRSQVAVVPGISRGYAFGGGSMWATNETRRLVLGPGSVRFEVVTPSTPPQDRTDGSLIYDPVRHRMILFGGGEEGVSGWLEGMTAVVSVLSLGSSPQWSTLNVTGTTPDPRTGLTGVYDPVRDRVLYFGGYASDNTLRQEVWALELSGAPEWRLLTPLGDAPAPRYNGAAVYDAPRDRMLVFGGIGYGVYYDDLWSLELGGVPRWTPHAAGPPGPRGRGSFADVFVDQSGRWVIAGGLDGHGVFGDTWILDWTAATPAQVSLISATATEGGVEIAWQLGAVAPRARLERRREGDVWSEILETVPGSDGRVQFMDRTVEPGGTYAYRLVVEGSEGEFRSADVVVRVPGRAVFALEGAVPNPVRRQATVRFSLPARGAASLEIVDVTGRRVLQRDLGAFGSGWHTVDLLEGRSFAPGVYVLRLSWEGQARTRRLVVVK